MTWRNRKSIKLAAFAFALSIIITSGCRHQRSTVARSPRPPVQPSRTSSRHAAVPVGYSEEGVASWYGVPYHGRPAADGEIYDMETLVAAHRVMPFNTWLRVTNLANNEAVNVRVIDRGPFVKGRMIDLSKAAARAIGLLGPGIGKVRIEVIAAPRDIPLNDYYAVQTGAFANRESAERLREHYARKFGNAQLALKHAPTPLWRVLVGKEPSIEAAQQLAVVLGAENKNVFVVRLDETVLRGNATGPVSANPTQLACGTAGTLTHSSLGISRIRGERFFVAAALTKRALLARIRVTPYCFRRFASIDIDRQFSRHEAGPAAGFAHGQIQIPGFDSRGDRHWEGSCCASYSRHGRARAFRSCGLLFFGRTAHGKRAIRIR